MARSLSHSVINSIEDKFHEEKFVSAWPGFDV